MKQLCTVCDCVKKSFWTEFFRARCKSDIIKFKVFKMLQFFSWTFF